MKLTVQRTGRPPVPVDFDLACDADGVHLAFPDGRTLRLSVTEWMAVGRMAVRDGAVWQESVLAEVVRGAHAEIRASIRPSLAAAMAQLDALLEDT